MKYIAAFSLIFLFSCGDVATDNSRNSLNDRFATTELEPVATTEKALREELCTDLTLKKDIFKRSYLSKRFVYDATKIECEETEATQKDITLTLEESGTSLRFKSSADDFFAFLNPEFNDSYGVFAKFCEDLESNDRFVFLSSNEVMYFEVKERSNFIEAIVTTAFFDVEEDGQRTFRVYKKENINYNTREEPNRPRGLVTSRSLESTAGCDGQDIFEKSNILTNIRD